MAICIRSVCGKCNHAETRFINVCMEYEVDCVQYAINTHDDYRWTIEDKLFTLYVW